jgi:hypothetical protein
MGVLEDMLKALDRIDAWRDLQAVPAKMKALEDRMASLEAALARCPAEGCPFCGARAFRLERVDMHGQREIWECGDCGKKREVRHDLMKGSRRSGPVTFGKI